MSKRQKPSKPRPDYPLYPGSNGQWIKRIGGKQYCFGPWRDPQAALAEYVKHRDYILANGCKMPDHAGYTVRDACNMFMQFKEDRLLSGEIRQRYFDNCLIDAKLVADVIGRDKQLDHLCSDDFAKLRSVIATNKSGEPAAVSTIAARMSRCRAIVTFAIDEGMLQRPLRQVTGRAFDPPSLRAKRRDRRERPKKYIPADVLRDAIEHACPQIRAMTLLGVNGGFANSDCSTLLIDEVNFSTGFIDILRQKTTVPRRVPLWDRTQAALREVIDNHRGTLPNVFVTHFGNPWGTPEIRDCPIGAKFLRLLKKRGTYQPGRSFSALRHVFRTEAEAGRDKPAVDVIAGHADNSIASVYRERIDDERLFRITEIVEKWLDD
jgi:integrase